MAKIKKELVVHTFHGGRFDDNGVDLDVLPDLLAYKTLLVETAKELWRQKNPSRERLPKNFEDSLSLKFYEIRQGSAAIPIIREIEADNQLPLLATPNRDELDDAVDLIAETIDAVDHNQTLPGFLPKNVIPLFESYGKTLRDDEWIGLRPSSRKTPVRYSGIIRERLGRWSQSLYEDSVDMVGSVTMARVNRPRMAITIDDGREIEAAFNQEDEALITTALKEHATAKLRIEGRAQFSPVGQVLKITHVTRLTLLPSGQISFDPLATPIWTVFSEIIKDIPDKQIRKLPRDSAENHDHYIYGTAKRKS